MSESITVLMPTYNDSQYLTNSIKSILNQNYEDFEFMIVDDGSNDNTEEVLSGIKDSRINYKKIPHSGLAAVLNYGLKNSYGDWIARIDADDVNTINRLQTQLDFIRKNPEYDIISSWSVYFKDPDKILFFLKTPTEDREIKKFLNLHNPINHSSVFFYKRRILDEGGYNENYKSYEDFELWFRLKDKMKFYILPEYLVYTRLRKNSLTKKERGNNIYKLLFDNARLKYNNAKTEEDKYYWNNILFWIEYFYGDKRKTKNYFSKDYSSKKILAYLNTFLPDKTFNAIIDLRLRYRLQTINRDKKKFRVELEKLFTS